MDMLTDIHVEEVDEFINSVQRFKYVQLYVLMSDRQVSKMNPCPRGEAEEGMEFVALAQSLCPSTNAGIIQQISPLISMSPPSTN